MVLCKLLAKRFLHTTRRLISGFLHFGFAGCTGFLERGVLLSLRLSGFFGLVWQCFDVLYEFCAFLSVLV